MPERKPDTCTAMRRLIARVRDTLPFGSGSVCTGQCDGCSLKLLSFLDDEILGWEQRLDAGETPSLGDLDKLGRTSLKVHNVLLRNGLVPPLEE